MRISILRALCLTVFGSCTASHAQDVSELRQAYRAHSSQIERLETAGAEARARIEALEAGIESRRRHRDSQVEEVRRQRDALSLQLADTVAERTLQRRKAQSIADSWNRVLEFPGQYSAAERRRIRDSLAAARRALESNARNEEQLRTLLRQRTDALAAAEFDVAFLEQLHRDYEAIDRLTLENLLRHDAIVGLRNDQAATVQAFMAQAREAPPAVVESVTVKSGTAVYHRSHWELTQSQLLAEYATCGPGAGPGTGEGATDASATRRAQSAAEQLQRTLTTTRRSLEERVVLWEARLNSKNAIAQAYLKQRKLIDSQVASAAIDIGDYEAYNLYAKTVVAAVQVVIDVGLTAGAGRAVAAGDTVLDSMSDLLRRSGWNAPNAVPEFTKDALKQRFVQEYATRMTANEARVFADIYEDMAGEAFDAVYRARRAELSRSVRELALLGKYGPRGARQLGADAVQSALTEAAAARGVDVDSQALRAGSVVAGDLLSIGLDRALLAAALGGGRVLDRLEANGALARRLRDSTPDRLSDLLPRRPTDVVRLASTAAKAAIEYFYAGKIDAATERLIFWQTESRTLALAYNELNRDRVILQGDLEYLRQQLAKTTEELTGLRRGRSLTRRLVIEVDEPITDPEQDYELVLRFSESITTAPDVRLGDVRLPRPADAAIGEREWRLRLPAESLPELRRGRHRLAIRATDPLGRALDASPATLPFARLGAPGFHLYDGDPPVADGCYRVDTDPTWPLRLRVDTISNEYDLKFPQQDR